jgi:hypothetical protein
MSRDTCRCCGEPLLARCAYDDGVHAECAREEREAWDRYAAGVAARTDLPSSSSEGREADKILAERRARFGGAA